MLRLAALEKHIAPAGDPLVRSGCPSGAQAEEGLEGCHRLLPAVVAEYELIEVGLELDATDTMVGANQPVLQIPHDAVGERYDRTGSFAERQPKRLLSAMCR